LDGKGGALALDWRGVESWRPEQGPLWVHVDPREPRAMSWLRERSGLSAATVDELLRDDLQPRIEELSDGAVVASLRGVASDLERAGATRTQIHLWVNPTRLISICERALPRLEGLRRAYAEQRGPSDLPGLVAAMAEALLASLRQGALQLEAPSADIEYAAEVGRADTSASLRELRNRVAAIRRLLAPFKVLVERTLALEACWLVQGRLKEWRRLADQLRDTDALLQSLYDRLLAVHDYIGERLSRDMNAILYRLTIFSTILLPITAVTGLLGMNVGVAGASYRFMGGSLAFVAVVVVLVVLAWLEYHFMRKRRLLLPRHVEPLEGDAG
jgi:zinc transporter